MAEKKPAGGKGPAPKKETAPAAEYDFRQDMMRSILTGPLLDQTVEFPERDFDVIITLNELHCGGLEAARQGVLEWLDKEGIIGTRLSSYVTARMKGSLITRLVAHQRQLFDEGGKEGPHVFRVWEDTEVSTCLTRSLATVKADAAHRSFNAYGEGIVWAVLDSGIDKTHPHFRGENSRLAPLDTLGPPAPVDHQDFTPGDSAPLEDKFRHGGSRHHPLKPVD